MQRRQRRLVESDDIVAEDKAAPLGQAIEPADEVRRLAESRSARRDRGEKTPISRSARAVLPGCLDVEAQASGAWSARRSIHAD